ncbi:MAG TPA: hypothetical protein VFO24_05470, partial [Usitatibacter sp.]|nr:hypothetical protein [Usitatibacter sp.]
TAVAGTAAALVLAACQTLVPVYTVNDAVVSTASGKHPSAGQVRSAIITAGTSLGWHVVDAGPGHLAGTLHLRTHTAVVDIPYGATKYSILYRSSEDLQAADGKIHRNYNGWVQNLDRQIRTELSRL